MTIAPALKLFFSLSGAVRREVKGDSVRRRTTSRAGRRSAALLVSALTGLTGALFGPSSAHGLIADSGGVNAPSLVRQDDAKITPIANGDIANEGVLTGDPADGVKWTITTPGGRMTDKDTLTIKDQYGTTGSTLDVKENGVALYRVRNTDQCRQNRSSAGCSQALYPEAGEATGKTTVNIDDDADSIDVIYANGAKFTDEYIYVLEIGLKVKEKILAGARFNNEAQVNDNRVRASVAKIPAGGEKPAVGSVTVSKVFNDQVPPPGVGPQFLPVPQTVRNQVPNAKPVPPDAVFTVRYSYTYEGEERSGTLRITGPGRTATLNNVPVGSVVTLTEDQPEVPGVSFGDPVFSGRDVTDGVPDARSAQVTVNGFFGTFVRLKNPIATKLATVEVTPGVCAPGATEPSEPTVTIGESEDVTYSQPEITKDGKQVTVKVTATPAAGRTIDGGNLPEGWVANGDGSFTFTKTISQPDCAAVPVVPDVKPGVCPVDSATPTQPTVSGVEDTDSIDYGEPVFGTNGNEVTVTVTATPRNGSRIDVAKLPEGWSVVDGVVTYTSTITQPRCVVPVVPTVDVGSCPVGATTPTAPSASIDEAEGLEFSEPRIEVRDGKVSVSAAATAKAGYQIGGPLPEGWTRVNETSATFTTVKDQPSCDAPTPTPTPSPSVSLTPDPSPSPVPSSSVPVPGVTVTPTVPVPVPTPVRPGLPRTGA